MKTGFGKKLAGIGQKHTFDKGFMFCKVMQIINASCLIINAIVRMAHPHNMWEYTSWMFTFYMLMFATVFFLVEFSCCRSCVWFYFLNFGWGKAIALLFISTLMLGSGTSVSAADVIFGCIFLLETFVFWIISCIYSKDEFAKIKEVIEESEAKAAGKATGSKPDKKKSFSAQSADIANRA